MTIEPDTKDWTWVLEHPCTECGFTAADLEVEALPQHLRANANAWREVLASPDAMVRPAGNVWSPTEYACHVRDVHRVFLGRVNQMLEHDDPLFDNWDQDETAIAGRYDEQQADVVVDELIESAEAVAAAYAGVSGEQWARPGRRSNGSLFTVESLGRYHLHDVVHHLYDVRHVAPEVL